MQTRPVTDSLLPPERREDSRPSRLSRWARIGPALSFACVELVALPVLMVLGRARWFYNDDWDFLVRRMHFSSDALLRGYYGHWCTLPIIAYQVVWSLVGLHHYWPYQLLVVVSHLVLCAMLLVVMRRAGVAPWIATLAAAGLVFFGTGAEDILVAFQVQFVCALAFGVLDLLLVDFDGPLGRRDVIGLGCGLLALMCSNVGLAMVMVVGVATLLRRGWRIAAFHTVPLALIYIAWTYRYTAGPPAKHSSVGELVRFVAVGVRGLFRGLGQVPGSASSWSRCLPSAPGNFAALLALKASGAELPCRWPCCWA